MSFVNRQPVTPPRRRSSSAARSESSYNTRPHSLGSYGSNTVPYSNASNRFSTMSKYDNYGINYQSPYFSNTYRGSTTSSLKIPAKMLSNSISKFHINTDNYMNGEGGRRSAKRTNVYSRESSLSRSRNSLCSSGMGSRSVSLTSLYSDGYAVSTIYFYLGNGKQVYNNKI